MEECRYCDDDVLFTSEYVCDAHQWCLGLGDADVFGRTLSAHTTEWEAFGRIKVCGNCGKEYQAEYRWSTVWGSRGSYGRRVYRLRTGKYCSEACRKALARKKPPSWRARNKAMDEKYSRCRFWRVCGKWVIGKRSDAKYCSPECRRRWWKGKKTLARRKKKDQG